VTETGTPAEARDHIANLEKDLTKTKASLETALTVNKGFQAKEVFATAGFESNLADLYVSANPEGKLSPEAATEWAKGFGFVPKTKETKEIEAEGGTETVTDGSEQLADMGRGGSSPGGAGQPPPAKDTMSRTEWQQLYTRDPVAAKKAVADGKVEIRGDNPYAKDYVQGENPYRDRGAEKQTAE
jgi:hypothetical protein